MCLLQKWLEAIAAHSAFSTHYCSQDQASEEDEEELISLGQLTETLQVTKELIIIYFMYKMFYIISFICCP